MKTALLSLAVVLSITAFGQTPKLKPIPMPEPKVPTLAKEPEGPVAKPTTEVPGDDCITAKAESIEMTGSGLNVKLVGHRTVYQIPMDVRSTLFQCYGEVREEAKKAQKWVGDLIDSMEKKDVSVCLDIAVTGEGQVIKNVKRPNVRSVVVNRPLHKEMAQGARDVAKSIRNFFRPKSH